MYTLVEILLTFAISVIVYTFFGYPILACLLSRIFPRLVQKASIHPSVTLLIPAYNEKSIIREKIENSLSLSYPADLLHIVIVADGSNDDTVEIASGFASHNVTVYHQPERQGKATAVNRVMPYLTSEIVVLTDANAMLVPETLRKLVRNFADPNVAAVAGAKRVKMGGEGLYWRYESHLKQCDSRLSSVMGAAGELFAVRRELYIPPPADSIIEDFVASMTLVGEGWRVIYEPEAVAYEDDLSSTAGDWHRRTRIAAGGLQAVLRLPQILRPKLGRIVWQYVSHRVLRWVATPFLLPAVFLLNLALRKRPFYRLLLAGQTAFYAAGLWGYLRARQGRRQGLPYVIFYFCFTNLAALVGIWRYVRGRQSVTWTKTR